MINPHLIVLRDKLFLPVDADSCIKLTAGLTAAQVKADSYQLCLQIMQQGQLKIIGSC